MVRRGQNAGHSFEGEVVPVKYSSWKEWKFVVISRSSYQPVRQRVIMSREYIIYFYFLHMNEEHLNIQQWDSKTQNTYNKHVQTKTDNQLCNR